MPTRPRPADPTPDLFASSPRTAKRAAAPSSEAKPSHPASRPKPLLPKDLAGSLKRLADTEIDALLAAVAAEAKRRGRLPQNPRETTHAQAAPRRAAAVGGATSLTTGKLNAVRAAFKAGVRPSAIARQFGISQTDVKRALAAQKAGR